MQMELWEELEKIGKLYVEEELVVGIEPVLQVCVDRAGYNRYLVMTYDSGEGEYVLCRIESRALLDMLENRRTMEETFRAANRIYKTRAAADSDCLQLDETEACEFPAELLPDKGAYYEISSEYIRKYIERLKKAEIEVKLEEACEIIERKGIRLPDPRKKMQIEYDLSFAEGSTLKVDYQNACSNRYPVKYSKFSAA
ncbi:MAG: hypothetical protein NC548_28115 [Lachnospiraceae bacterium]|nr:hypothetical protein [Lachnospiraceae bacterium]